MSIRVTNIQRMCFDDGPGIRTTVFLKGCSLRCPWCSNPENLKFEKENYFIPERGKKGVYGKDYEPEELLEELLKDRKYWGADGGVTFSGGEALLQAQELESLWRMLKAEGIHLAVETGLFVSDRQVELADRYIDYFYVDVKLLEAKLCREVLGGDVAGYLKNVERLAAAGADIHFRVPCSMEYVLGADNRELLFRFFKKYVVFPIEIFGIHNLGKAKYESLNKKIPEFREISKADLEYLKAELTQIGCNVEIIAI